MDVEKVLKVLGVEVVGGDDRRVLARCPWPANHANGDANPSFSVFVDTGYWTCFTGCGGGPMTSLVASLLGMTKNSALKWLLVNGGEVSVTDVWDCLPSFQENPPSSDHKTFMIDYNQQISDRTSSYIVERGFTRITLKKWGFRYDPVNLAIVIPVLNIAGTQLVGIIRRAVPGSSLPVKYFYSPGFNKSQHLFGANHHPKDGMVMLVEGSLDAVWLHQHGINQAVALLGVTCSPTQQKLLASLGDTVVLALDNDLAGRQATETLKKQLQKQFNVLTVCWPAGVKDPQELSSEEIGALEFAGDLGELS